MARKKNTTNLTELLLQCVTQPVPPTGGFVLPKTGFRKNFQKI